MGGRLRQRVGLEEEQARGLTLALALPPPPFRPQGLVCSTDPQVTHGGSPNLSDPI